MRIRHIEVRNFRGIHSLSWRVKGDFNCLIGSGDSCKTTILTALDYALSPRTALTFDDADFFNQDVEHPIIIQVTLNDWDEADEGIRKFFQESKFAQFKCGLSDAGAIAEPPEGGRPAVSISLRVDKSLEPKWTVTRGRDETEDQDRKPIYAIDRAVIGLTRIDLHSDAHFTWGRNTVLTRLSANNDGNLTEVLATLSRDMRQADISQHQSIVGCQTVADGIKQAAIDNGVQLTDLVPKIDIQRQAAGTGAVSLHEGNVPLRNKGSGSKKLIAAAMQMKLHGGKNISLIDEIEVGLEPHRIRGFLIRLSKSPQQIFTTTHSAVVLRELDATANELYVCKRDADGNVTVTSMATVPDIQANVRSNAEAFLGNRIVAAEGSTEIGCVRAYDEFRLDENDPPVWTLGTAYFNCGGASHIKAVCPKLAQLGYRVATLCDNDAPQHLSDTDVATLRAGGTHVCWWDNGNSTEKQLFIDMPWEHIPTMLAKICEHHDTLELATVIDRIQKEPRVAALNLTNDPAQWTDNPLLRQVMGDLAHEGNWIKRVDLAGKAFRWALPLLPDTTVIKTRLAQLWTWIQAP